MVFYHSSAANAIPILIYEGAFNGLFFGETEDYGRGRQSAAIKKKGE